MNRLLVVLTPWHLIALFTIASLCPGFSHTPPPTARKLDHTDVNVVGVVTTAMPVMPCYLVNITMVGTVNHFREAGIHVLCRRSRYNCICRWRRVQCIPFTRGADAETLDSVSRVRRLGAVLLNYVASCIITTRDSTERHSTDFRYLDLMAI